jgi:hypothetical protein
MLFAHGSFMHSFIKKGVHKSVTKTDNRSTYFRQGERVVDDVMRIVIDAIKDNNLDSFRVEQCARSGIAGITNKQAGTEFIKGVQSQFKTINAQELIRTHHLSDDKAKHFSFLVFYYLCDGIMPDLHTCVTMRAFEKWLDKHGKKIALKAVKEVYGTSSTEYKMIDAYIEKYGIMGLMGGSRTY